MPAITTRDLEAIIQMFERSDWKELELQFEGHELFLSKDPARRASWEGAKGAAAPAPQPAAPGSAPVPAAGAAEPAKAHSAAPAVAPPGCAFVTAPSLGTFYRAAKPGAPPFVEIGQQVDADTELCLIEVMKLFTTLRAGMAGKVREILVADGQLVEFGQPLVLIQTDG